MVKRMLLFKLFSAIGKGERKSGFYFLPTESRVIGTEPVDVVTTALRPEVKCKWNFRVRPEIEFDKVDTTDYDALAIPGGFDDAGFYDDVFDNRFLVLVRQRM